MFRRSVHLRRLAVLGVASALIGVAAAAGAGGLPSNFASSFAFPVSFANGVVGDLVPPVGSSAKFSFDNGKIAIGELPIPMPLAVRRGRGRGSQKFVRIAEAGPHARLMLNGVVDADGTAVSNTGNQLIVDAVVSPSGAATNPPPFVIAFDINNGSAFVDTPLPIQRQADGPVNMQILAVSVNDPDGSPFAVLGLELAPLRPTPVPRVTPTPGGTPQPDGECFVDANCTGPSFPASQEKCCHFIGRPTAAFPQSTSWCPPQQFDPTTGQCAMGACLACVPSPPPAGCADRTECTGSCTIACADGHIESGVCQKGPSCACSASCEPQPTPTPGPEPCGDSAGCNGTCSLTCADGTIVIGQCSGGEGDTRCKCSAACVAPTPCSVGQCFDTITGRCTGQACGPDGLHCALPNQLCDVSGKRCPCAPPHPILPHGHICCQCKEAARACFDFEFVEVQPICPPGCETFMGSECDKNDTACVPLTACSTDRDCDDGNGCTIDRCTDEGCTHECVCVGPRGCQPGPEDGPQHH